MHNTRTYMRRVVIVSLLGTMSTLNACSTPAPTAMIGSSAVRATYDGEALFLGIFFGEGAVGKSLSEIWSGGGAEAMLTSPEQVAKLHRFESAAIASLRSSDPTFFDRFARATQSGDYMAVQSAIDEAAAKLEATAHSYVASAQDGNAVGDDAVVTVTVAVAGAVVVAVAAAVVLVAVVGRKGVLEKPDDALRHDTLINAIVVHLAAGPIAVR